ncbi:hypothetical protein BHE74_00004124 [Ensete ventricosum]|nr:hypothetical protein BHE74_00004124 [Ensete ventricosum]
MYCGSLANFDKLSINVLVFRLSEANQELSLELSPRRDSVIGERALDPASGWRATRVVADVAADGEEWLAAAIEEESKAAVKVSWKRLDCGR